MPFILVPAAATDWDLAWAIQREAFLDLVNQTSGGWTEELVQQCASAWAPEHTRMVHVEDEVVGWVRLEHRADHDWLDLIVVAKSLHGRGLGAAVMRQLLDEARSRGVPLRLSVYRTNPARRLYARLGFLETPRDELRVLMVAR